MNEKTQLQGILGRLVLAPVVPTPTMDAAGKAALSDNGVEDVNDSDALVCYAAMLAALPQQEQSGDGSKLLYVGFDKQMERRLFHTKETAERHCVGNIDVYAKVAELTNPSRDHKDGN